MSKINLIYSSIKEDIEKNLINNIVEKIEIFLNT